jgi:hypothetical protein
MHASKTAVTAIVPNVAPAFAPTLCAATECAPSTRAPKSYDRAAKIAEIKAMLAGRMDRYQAA